MMGLCRAQALPFCAGNFKGIVYTQFHQKEPKLIDPQPRCHGHRGVQQRVFGPILTATMPKFHGGAGKLTIGGRPS